MTSWKQDGETSFPDSLLTGVRCQSCGYLSVPTQSKGCRLCGACDENLQIVGLSGLGTTIAAAQTHPAGAAAGESGALAAKIKLNEGPVIHGLIRTDNGLDPVVPSLVRVAEGSYLEGFVFTSVGEQS